MILRGISTWWYFWQSGKKSTTFSWLTNRRRFDTTTLTHCWCDNSRRTGDLHHYYFPYESNTNRGIYCTLPDTLLTSTSTLFYLTRTHQSGLNGLSTLIYSSSTSVFLHESYWSRIYFILRKISRIPEKKTLPEDIPWDDEAIQNINIDFNRIVISTSATTLLDKT